MAILVDRGGVSVRGADLSALRGDNLALEDYLEALTAPMVGLVPCRVRLELRAEARAHLERQIERLKTEGIGEPEATRLAIEAYGSAAAIGDAFLSEWFQNQSRSPFLKQFGHANYVAFGWFAVAQAIYTCLLHLRVFLPSGAAYSFPITPAEMRRVVPAPLPMPELTTTSIFLFLFPFVAPIVAGYLTGTAVPVRSARAVYQAMMPIILYSFVIGALMLPMTEGLLFALFQVVYWIPVGALAAHVGMVMAARRRSRTGGVL
ncbi:MAG TPA: hypothetical protein VHE55_11740 [Fimbriimonadaceae bacterium]|nr:hypothetical protein [Fimbriimonadaceae bacterium]